VNSLRDNLEFKMQFCTTNLRYLLGEPKPFTENTQKQIDFMKSEIKMVEEQLSSICEGTEHVRVS
jgi:hypothetical protein